VHREKALRDPRRARGRWRRGGALDCDCTHCAQAEGQGRFALALTP
jgi:hypothetical protein